MPTLQTGFDQLARLVADPLFLLSSDGVILELNKPAADLAGHIQPRETRLHALVSDPSERIDRYLTLCARSMQPLPGSLNWLTDQKQLELRCDGGVLCPRMHDRPAVILLHCRPKSHAVEQFNLLNQKIAELTSEIIARREAERERDQLLQRERMARQEAESASRLKDEFLATLSHELRTPISAILGWSQMMQGGNVGEREFKEGLAVIERNAKTQARLIEDLLDMSRIISGKIRLDLQDVDLSAVISAAVDSVRPAADAKGIRLQVVIDPIAGPVRGDPARLQQIVWNLLTNAVKFTPRGGRVQVFLERVNSHLEISVVDNGVGIKPEFLPHLFERFRQGDASSTRAHGGLGLGLAIVKHLTELHGGTVRAKSRGSNEGATFTISLPRPLIRPEADADRVHPTAEYSEPSTIKFADLHGIKVLVVDDEPDSQQLARLVLSQCGAEVETAGSAPEALRLFQQQDFDVLLSDIGMPGMDGLELIQEIRRRPIEHGGRIPAAALTAFARSIDRQRALLAGFDMHISKPVEPAELTMVVATLSRRA